MSDGFKRGARGGKIPGKIKRILVANRGEIAVRIIRCCHEMGIETVAVYSTADRDSLHVRLAERAVCVGPAPSAKSYLDRQNLLVAALGTDCDAVHPGAGFLSENPEFAKLVRGQGLVFVGPSPEVMELLGDKIKARETAARFGIPVTPGSAGAVVTDRDAREAVKRCGFPVIIKAAAGGGGKGMRIVREEKDLEENLNIARAEARANFASDTVFIERCLENPRHVELQLLADGSGKVAVLGERDCSVQKNHQKLIEESPSPGVTEKMRGDMVEGAVKLFRDLKYTGAGTIEFLVEGEKFYFMEVNARLQVEHPVSEFVTGTDIVRQQILCCAEGRMELDDGAVPVSGWSLECRINALAPGKITRLEIPGGPGVRFDSALYPGCAVTPFYDAMTAKLIVHGQDREHALSRMTRSLDELIIEGIKTNISRQRRIIAHGTFRSGNFGNRFYETVSGEIEKE